HASSSGVPCVATASCWCCARSRVIVHRPRAYCSGWRRMAYRTISANSVLVARAATWRRHRRCSPDAGSRSWFGPEPFSDALAERLARGDIHPSGPLWGQGEPPTQGDAGALEREIGAAHGDLVAGVAAARMDQERRPLRLLPGHLRWRWLDDAMELSFELPAGAYATVVVREVAAI